MMLSSVPTATQLIVFRPSDSCAAPLLDLGPLWLTNNPGVTNLGYCLSNWNVIFKLNQQINCSWSCFFIIQGFYSRSNMSYLLKFLNILFMLLPQLAWTIVMHFAWAIPMLHSHSSVISHILASRHWLFICFRVHFKISSDFKTFKGSVTTCISELLTPYIPLRLQRSIDKQLLVIPKSLILKNQADQAFSGVAFKLCNHLPAHVGVPHS